MSDPRAKAERSRAKDLRQGVVEQRPVSSSKAKKKPWVLVGEWAFLRLRPASKECVLGRFATKRDAEKALEAALKKPYYINLRIEEQ